MLSMRLRCERVWKMDLLPSLQSERKAFLPVSLVADDVTAVAAVVVFAAEVNPASANVFVGEIWVVWQGEGK